MNNIDNTFYRNNTRIKESQPLIKPSEIIEKYPLDDSTADFVSQSRIIISNILNFNDNRLLIVVGPCSIHNEKEALEYAEKLNKIKENYPHLYIVMRTYFEKPRTNLGWKGFINDPDLNETYDVNKGLEKSRELLLKINQMGLSTATEFLDTITPQYISDLISWGAIGARTTESQEHRKLASGLSMPIGFKNGTNGDIDTATHACLAASHENIFAGTNLDGNTCLLKTTGNTDTHIILRGGKNGPNYTKEYVDETNKQLKEMGIKTGIVIDFSHANSGKNYKNQMQVALDVGEQLSNGNDSIVGVMIESNINEGKQNLSLAQKLSKTYGKNTSDYLEYGVSITDSCVNIKETQEILEGLNNHKKVLNK